MSYDIEAARLTVSTQFRNYPPIEERFVLIRNARTGMYLTLNGDWYHCAEDATPPDICKIPLL